MHNQTVRSVAVSFGNNRVVSGSDDRTVCIWEMSTGRILRTLKVRVISPSNTDSGVHLPHCVPRLLIHTV